MLLAALQRCRSWLSWDLIIFLGRSWLTEVPNAPPAAAFDSICPTYPYTLREDLPRHADVAPENDSTSARYHRLRTTVCIAVGSKEAMQCFKNTSPRGCDFGNNIVFRAKLLVSSPKSRNASGVNFFPKARNTATVQLAPAILTSDQSRVPINHTASMPRITNH